MTIVFMTVYQTTQRLQHKTTPSLNSTVTIQPTIQRDPSTAGDILDPYAFSGHSSPTISDPLCKRRPTTRLINNNAVC